MSTTNPSPTLHTAEELAADEALGACLRLAEGLCNAELDAKDQLGALMEAMESLARSHAQQGPFEDLSTLLATLEENIQSLFPRLDPLPLLEQIPDDPKAFSLTPYAIDLLARAESDSLPAKVAQAFRARRATLASMEDQAEAQRRYVEFRRFLIQNPITKRVDAYDHLTRIPGFDDQGLFYQAIPGERLDDDGAGAKRLFPCRRCGWPLRKTENRLECDGVDCREHGAIYDFTEGGRLQLAGGMELPDALIHDDNCRMLTPLAWQSYCLPGLYELELLKSLTPTVEELTLWPKLDTVDLAFRLGDRWVQVDVKSGRAVNLMILDLNQRPPPKPLHIVLPDARATLAGTLRRAIKNNELHRNYRVHSISGFLRWVRMKRWTEGEA